MLHIYKTLVLFCYNHHIILNKLHYSLPIVITYSIQDPIFKPDRNNNEHQNLMLEILVFLAFV